MIKTKYNIGVVGAGGFSRFAMSEFIKNSKVAFVGVYDTDTDKSQRFAQYFKGTLYKSYSELLTSNDIDIVYIATPPYLHFEQSMQGLKAGKHVICEKPVSFNYEDSIKLKSVANECGLLFVVNLMQRYNPLYEQVKEILNSKVLGEFLHGFMENYASDQSLSPEHWFWDPNMSGGIFIEHGVHFFDLFSGWLGKGHLINSVELFRKGTQIEDKVADRVQATVKYPKGIVNFYHGFDQADRFDRQEFRLLFERGDITLFEWVPTRYVLNALVNDQQYNNLSKILSPDNVVFKDIYDKKTVMRSRFKDYKVDLAIEFTGGELVIKEDRYRQMLGDFLEDQIKWIEDNKHERKITAQNAIDSIEMAINAHNGAITI